MSRTMKVTRPKALVDPENEVGLQTGDGMKTCDSMRRLPGCE